MEGIRWGDWPQSSLTNQCDQIEITSHLRVIHFLYIHHEILWWSSDIKIWFVFSLASWFWNYLMSSLWYGDSPPPLFSSSSSSSPLPLSLSLSLSLSHCCTQFSFWSATSQTPLTLRWLEAKLSDSIWVLWQFLWRIFAFNDSCNFLLILR